MAADGGAGVVAEDGCCFRLTDAGGSSIACNAPRQARSSYCPEHHAACRVAPGSTAEGRRIEELEALAAVVGGKQGLEAKQPPARLMRRLLGVERRFSRQHRS